MRQDWLAAVRWGNQIIGFLIEGFLMHKRKRMVHRLALVVAVFVLLGVVRAVPAQFFRPVPRPPQDPAAMRLYFTPGPINHPPLPISGTASMPGPSFPPAIHNSGFQFGNIGGGSTGQQGVLGNTGNVGFAGNIGTLGGNVGGFAGNIGQLGGVQSFGAVGALGQIGALGGNLGAGGFGGIQGGLNFGIGGALGAGGLNFGAGGALGAGGINLGVGGVGGIGGAIGAGGFGGKFGFAGVNGHVGL